MSCLFIYYNALVHFTQLLVRKNIFIDALKMKKILYIQLNLFFDFPLEIFMFLEITHYNTAKQ